MNGQLNWGVLSTARIGTEKVIPAIQKSSHGRVVAIASRDEQRASAAAAQLGIDRSFGSYEALLADESIDVIYNPLPNHLHVAWSEKALAAGKHVLCEKPIGLNVAEARRLASVAAQYPELKVMEAFMYRFHPQWQKAREWIEQGRLGKLLTIQTLFSYYNDDAENIRNQADIGGGGLMDIGCYPISQSRFLFDREPVRVFASMDIHPGFGTDVIASGILDYEAGSATFTCSTQMSAYQRTHILGTTGQIEIEIPVNAPADEATTLWLTEDGQRSVEQIAPCDQYTLQADAMALAIINDTGLPVTLDDAIGNMRVIDAAVKSHQSGCWEIP